MPGTPTSNWSLPTVSGSADLISDGDTSINNLATTIDTKMVGYTEGLVASRPTSSVGTPGIKGRVYRATDTGQWFLDTGTGWQEIASGTSTQTWQTITASGWGTPNTLYYYKDPLAVVHFRGTTIVAPGFSVTAGSTVCTMPAGYRPIANVVLTAFDTGSTTTNYPMTFTTTGTVICVNSVPSTRAVSFGNITYRAEQ